MLGNRIHLEQWASKNSDTVYPIRYYLAGTLLEIMDYMYNRKMIQTPVQDSEMTSLLKENFGFRTVSGWELSQVMCYVPCFRAKHATKKYPQSAYLLHGPYSRLLNDKASTSSSL